MRNTSQPEARVTGRSAGAARLLLLLFIFLMMAELAVEPARAASAPKLRAKRSDKNILLLVKKYDKDAYHILKKEKDNGHKLRVWMTGKKRMIDGIDTCVHETNHLYIFEQAGYFATGELRFYMGGGSYIDVPQGEYMRTDKATRKIPKKLRTFRYSTYVKKGSNASANLMGHLGLLNEFHSYYVGFKTMYAMYPYMKARVKNANGWVPFVLSYFDEREAYAEFYYWTLEYLRYIKINKPDLYKKIMANKDFMRAFYRTERAYAALIKKYDKKMNAVSRRFNGRSVSASIRGGRFRMGKYFYPARTGYQKLKKEISKKKYSKVKRDIKKAAAVNTLEVIRLD